MRIIFLGLTIAALATPARAEVLLRIPFQSEPYEFYRGADQKPVGAMRFTQQKPGPKQPGQIWNIEHMKDGWNGRGFLRYYRWDYEVTKADGADPQVGWWVAGTSFRPGTEWPDVPYYLRFRMRTTAPIIPHPSGRSTAMKFLIWGGGGGRPAFQRIIMHFYEGSAIGKNDKDWTTIEVDAGVTQSFDCAAAVRNREWNHIQIAWKWGGKGAAFQRIYVNNNDVKKPNDENTDFSGVGGTWPFPGSDLNGQLFFGNIVSDNSRTSGDAIIDVMDVEVATSFDPAWAPAAPGSKKDDDPGHRDNGGFALAAAGILASLHGLSRLTRRSEQPSCS